MTYIGASQILSSIVRDSAGVIAGTGPGTNDKASMNHQLLYTVAECCRMAAIGRTKFYELVANGEIPIRKIGKKSLIAASDLRDWVERLPVIESKSGDRRTAHDEATR